MSDLTVDIEALLRSAETARGDAAQGRVKELAPELPFDEIWTPEPEAKLVIPGLGIAPGPVHLVTGTWYTGKTLLLLTMGLSVASGRALFGLWHTKRGRWIHFDHEMGRRGYKRYIQRLAAGLALGPDDLRGFMSPRVMPRLNLCHPDAVDLYTAALTGFDFCTIDPLRAATPGADENKSDFRQFLDMLAIVSDRTGCSIALLHHGGKPTQEPSARRNTGRGSSAIDDAVQTKLVLSAAEKGAPMLVTHEKTRELTGPVEDFWLEIDNSTPNAVRLVHRMQEEMEQRAERTKLRKEAADVARVRDLVVKQIVDAGGCYSGSRDELRVLTGARKELVTRAVAELVQSGRVRRGGSYHAPTLEAVG